MLTANIHQAKSQLSKLIEQALQGEEVVICKAGKPIVRLVQYEQPRNVRRGGQWHGQVEIAPDFDELPEELTAAFAGKKP